MIEILESRVAPATLSWTGATNSLWSVASNWSTATVPALGDILVINPNAAIE